MINFSKRDLWRYVNKFTKRIVHHYHVLAVISILFEEIVKQIKLGKPITIVNFGVLSLKETKPRKHYNVTTRSTTFSPAHKILHFVLDKKIKKLLIQHLDLNKTFK